jgi:hypothetical protein
MSAVVLYYATRAAALQHQSAPDELDALGISTSSTIAGTVNTGVSGYNGIGWRIAGDPTNEDFPLNGDFNNNVSGLSNPYYVYPVPVKISYYSSKVSADSGIAANDANTALTVGGTSGNRIGYRSDQYILAYDLTEGINGAIGGMPQWFIYDAGSGVTYGSAWPAGQDLYFISNSDGPFYVYPELPVAYISYYENTSDKTEGINANPSDSDNTFTVGGSSTVRIGYNSKDYTLGSVLSGADGSANGDASTNSATTWDLYTMGSPNTPVLSAVTSGTKLASLGPTSFYYAVQVASPTINVSFYLTREDALAGYNGIDNNSDSTLSGTSGKRIGYNTTDYTPGNVTQGANGTAKGYISWGAYNDGGNLVITSPAGTTPSPQGASFETAVPFGSSGNYYAFPYVAYISYYQNRGFATDGYEIDDYTSISTVSPPGPSQVRAAYSLTNFSVIPDITVYTYPGNPDLNPVLTNLGMTLTGVTKWYIFDNLGNAVQNVVNSSLIFEGNENLLTQYPSSTVPGYYAFQVTAGISYYDTESDATDGINASDATSIVTIDGGSTKRKGYAYGTTVGLSNAGNTGAGTSSSSSWVVKQVDANGNVISTNTREYNNTLAAGVYYAYPYTAPPSTPVISYYEAYINAQLGWTLDDNSTTASIPRRVGYSLGYNLGGIPDDGTTGNLNVVKYWIVYDNNGTVVNSGNATAASSLTASGSYYAFPAPAAISYYTSVMNINTGYGSLDQIDTSTAIASVRSGVRLGFSLNYTIGDTSTGLGPAGGTGTLSWTIYDSANNEIPGTKPLNDTTLLPITKEGQYYFAVAVPNGIVYYANQANADAGTNSIASSTSYTVATEGGYSNWMVSTRSTGSYNPVSEYSAGYTLFDGAGTDNYAYYLYPVPPPPATQANISYYSSKTGALSGIANTDYDNTTVVEGNNYVRIGFNSADFVIGTVDSTPPNQSTGNTSSWYVYDDTGTLLLGPYNFGYDLSSLPNNSYFYVFPAPNEILISYYANSGDAQSGQVAVDANDVLSPGGNSNLRVGLLYATYTLGNVDIGSNDSNGQGWGLIDANGVDVAGGPFPAGADLESAPGDPPYYVYPYTVPPPPATQANISYYLTDTAALSGYNSTDYSNIVTISTGSGRVGFNSANFLLGTVDSTPSGQSTGPPGTSSWYVYDDTGTLLSSAYSASDLSGLPNNSYFYVFPAATQANISYYASAADAAAGRTAGDNTSFSTGDVNGPSNLRIGFNSADFLIGVSDPGAGENGIDNNATGFTKSWYVILANGTTSGPVYLNTDLPTFVSSAYYFAYPIPTQISYYLNYTNANLGRIANDNATVATLQGASGQRIGYVISYSLGTLDSNSSTSTTGNNNTSPYWIVYDNTGAVVSSGDAMSPGLLNASGSYYAFPAPAFISYYLSVFDKDQGFNQNDHNDTTALGGYRFGFSLNYTVGDATSGQGVAGYQDTLSWTIYNSTNTSIGSKNLNDTSLVPSTKDGRYFYAVYNPNGIYYCATKADADAGGATRISQSSSYLIGSAGGFSSWKISETSAGIFDPDFVYNASSSTTLDSGISVQINYVYYLYPATAPPATPSFISYYLNYADAVNGRTANSGAGDNSDTSTVGGLSGLRIGYALTYSLGSTDDGTNGNDNAPQGRYWIVYNNSGTAVSSGNALSSGLLTATGSYYAFPAPAAISYYLSVDDKNAGRAAGDRIDTFSAIASSRSGVRLGFSLNYIVGVITSPNDQGDSGYSGTAFWTIYDSNGTILPSAAIKPLNDTTLVPSTKEGQYYYAVVVPNGIVYYANQANADAGTSSIASSTSYTVATQGSTSSWKMSTRSTGPDPSTTYDTGTTLDDGISSGINYAYYLYPATTPTPAPCFLEGTTILCLVKGVQAYVPVEEIKTGTLVKTAMDGFKPVKVIGTRTIENPGTDERLKDRLYKCSTSKYSELKEDLYITGCHSILVDTLTDEQRADMLTKQESIYITGDKYRLLACSDERAEPWASEGAHQIWHFALDHEDEKKNYGVYANGGLLVETCCLKRMKEKSYMILA